MGLGTPRVRGGEGAEVVYALRNNSNLARNVLESIGDAGQLTRKYYQRRLPSDPSKDYYFIHRETGRITPLLVEYGFIDTASDANRLRNNLDDYVEGVVKAVANYYGIPYTSPSGTTQNTYTVQSGDSLYSIARKFGTTVDELRRLNNLTSDVLQIGQRLIISEEETKPTPPTGNYTTYTVKSGDSLWKIANQFNTTVDELISLNNLSTTVLQVGQQLRVPSTAQIPSPTPPTENYTTYTVKSGDSLWKIANQFNTTVDELISLNNLSTTVLQVGQQLRVPSTTQTPSPTPPTENYTTYTVKSGDSLWKIANRFNTTVDAIINLNNLTTNLLQIGQELRIPTSGTSSNRVYVVKSGDSLWKIANQFNTTVDAIRRLNSLTSNTLQIGQELLIP